MSTLTLEEKTALVTGGSRGIGLATVIALAERGITVAAASRNPNEVDRATSDLPPSWRSRIVAVGIDVRDELSVRSAMAQIVQRFGGLDIVVNGAGISMNASRHLVDTTTAEWREMLDTNLTGTYLVCREALPHLEVRGGDIVNILSLASWRAKAGSSLYAATKFGARALTESLEAELRGSSTRVSSISPGQVDTAVWDRKIEPPTAAERAVMLRPSDIAQTIVWLLERPHGVHIPNVSVTPWYGVI